MKKALLHLVATIEYRFDHAISKIDDSYPTVKIGNGVRTPLEILYHMRGVMYYAIKVCSDSRTVMGEIEDWKTEESKFRESIEMVSNYIKDHSVAEDNALKIIQGPLSDVITHIGQLAMLSRVNKQPIEKQNYVKADIVS